MENVEYDDNVDMFSTSAIDEEHDNLNYFDLLVDSVDIDKFQVQEILKRRRLAENMTSSVKIVFLVEFFNHPVLTSQLYQEFTIRPDFQSSFAVQVNQDFLNYSLTGRVKVETYAIVGSERARLGETTFSLRSLMENNARNLNQSRGLCAVVRSRENIENTSVGHPIGLMNLVYRMRRPCGMAAKLYLDEVNGFTKPGATGKANQAVGTRRVVVRIISSQGLKEAVPTFVTYNMLDGITYYTNTVRGKDPVYNYTNSHNLVFSQDLKNRIATIPMEIVVYDDSVPATVQDGSDVIGIGSISLANLLVGKPVNETIMVKNTLTGTSCFVQIMVYIYDQEDDYFEKLKASHYNQDMEDSILTPDQRAMMMTSMNFGKKNAPQRDAKELLEEFATFIKKKNLTLLSAFSILDHSKSRFLLSSSRRPFCDKGRVLQGTD